MSQEIIKKYNNMPAILGVARNASENLVTTDPDGALRKVLRFLAKVEAKLIAALACAYFAHDTSLAGQIENAQGTIKGLKNYVKTLVLYELR